MLQFVAKPSVLYSVAEQAQMTIEGGVKWVIFDPVDLPDDAVRETLNLLTDLCKENSTILTIVNHSEAALEMKIHGVELTSAARALEVREQLGPEAIIGVAVGGSDGIEALRGKDMDYFVLPEDTSLVRMSEIVEQVRRSGDMSPIVARGRYEIAEIDAVMATGVSGIQLSSTITDAPDPVEAVQEILSILNPDSRS